MLYIQLYEVTGFIMTFPCTHIMHFDRIHLILSKIISLHEHFMINNFADILTYDPISFFLGLCYMVRTP